ncbi:CDP-diacylglycerol--glycerol-3-phosphate 3-phosphatidyltransferase [Acetivibrio cellulolyticus]|uniref:CDP-diacylglycerol--glycerol-3-phosphate 3-phosphatidyltransferase n=1 Tax=Acetivibrio cellulolyticus TaxID=35830 RepID=UPI0001E2F120|nr:CDP-diacylglycerol--glycerol-3-phosphate 3-phosphatidyltransferase [Acetivibrio cellulolyticus]
MNIPNILTVIRFFLVPAFGYCLYNEQFIAAVVLFVVACITDMLDGMIARKYNLITSFGKLADPLADKLMQLTALTILSIQEIIPLPVLIIVLAKEIFMILGSILLYKKVNFVVQANWYGKMTTVIFSLAIVMTIVLKSGNLINTYTNILIDIFVLIAVFSTLFSFFMYSMEFRKITNDKIN